MANEKFTRKPTSAGNRKTWTWSAWVKRNGMGSTVGLFGSNSGSSDTNYFEALFASGDNIVIQGSSTEFRRTRRLFRDSSSWYHIVIVSDGTNTLGANRYRIFVNGRQEDDFTTVNNPAQNSENAINQLDTLVIGGRPNDSNYIQAQFYDMFLIDGLALDPDVFALSKDGEGYESIGDPRRLDLRGGRWLPKKPSLIKSEINRRGGFGTNGFYLPMNDSSNPGAEFHCDPNSIIKLKGEDLAQPQNGAPTTSDSFVSQLRTDSNASNIVLAVPGISGGQGSGIGDYHADIKGSGTNCTVTANGDAAVADVASYYGSALNFDGTGDYIDVTEQSSNLSFTGDFTVELWVKMNTISSTNDLVGTATNTVFLGSSKGGWILGHTSSNGFRFGYQYNSAWTFEHSFGLIGVVNQWYHVAVSRENNTIRYFLNGELHDSQTTSASLNSTEGFARIGGGYGSTSGLIDGCIQDLRIYNGVAKYTGGFDVPKPFHPDGIESFRTVSDTTSNNFAILNLLQTGVNNTNPGDFTDGNLTVTYDASLNHGTTMCNFPIKPDGNWYAEARVGSLTASGGFSLNIGVTGIGESTDSGAVSFNEVGTAYRADGGEKRVNTTGNGGGTESSYGDSYGVGDIIGIHYNAGTLTFYKNGVSQGVATSNMNNLIGNLTNDLFFGCGDLGSGCAGAFTWNFGQNSTFSGNTTVGTFTDNNGKGLFKYQPPSGSLALCEDNLPTPTISDPGKHFKTIIYNGNGNTSTLTGVGFKPDLVWIKLRNDNGAHFWHDSVRGAKNGIHCNLEDAESEYSNAVLGFNNDGFSVGDRANINGIASRNYVAYCWKAGGAAVTNSEGSQTVQLSANPTAGFSIASVPGETTTTSTYGHGLGKAPEFIIRKVTNTTGGWYVWHKNLPSSDGFLRLDNTSIHSTTSIINGTQPTDTLVTMTPGIAQNDDGNTIITYNFTGIEGYSKYGFFNGADNTNGTFVYLGFKPALLLVKARDTVFTVGGSDATAWCIYDSARMPVNPLGNPLFAGTNTTESIRGNGSSANTGGNDGNNLGGFLRIDFLSNGFKCRSAGSEIGTAQIHVYAAWAESPFNTANSK